MMQSGHYHWYFNIPIFIIILVYLGAKYIPPNLGKVFVGLLVLLSISSASFVQYSSYIYHKKEVALQQDFAQIFDWLNIHTQNNSVVLANEPISLLIPAFTHNNVFEHLYGNLSLISPERRAYTASKALKDLFSAKKLPFRLDYIVWDTLIDPGWEINTIAILKEEVDFGRLQIYSLPTCPHIGC